MLDSKQQLEHGAAMRREAEALLRRGREDDAIIALRTATRAYSPDNPDCAVELAESLGELSSVLRGRGRTGEALESAEQAMRVVARLARDDAAQHLALLSRLTDNLGRCCQRAAQYDRAAAAYEQAVGGYRILAEFQPEVHGLTLVEEMSRHGLALAQCGQLDEAYGVAGDFVERGRELLPRSLPLVTGGLMFMADVASDLGRPDARLDHLGDGVRLLGVAIDDELPGAQEAQTRMLEALREAAEAPGVELPADLADLLA